MKNYFVRYDMIGADLNYGVCQHPQKQMMELVKDLNFKVIGAEPVSIADCWMFWLESENKNLELPGYIKILDYISIEDWNNPKHWKRAK
jgi:hypothetical protein